MGWQARERSDELLRRRACKRQHLFSCLRLGVSDKLAVDAPIMASCYCLLPWSNGVDVDHASAGGHAVRQPDVAVLRRRSRLTESAGTTTVNVCSSGSVHGYSCSPFEGELHRLAHLQRNRYRILVLVGPPADLVFNDRHPFPRPQTNPAAPNGQSTRMLCGIPALRQRRSSGCNRRAG